MKNYNIFLYYQDLTILWDYGINKYHHLSITSYYHFAKTLFNFLEMHQSSQKNESLTFFVSKSSKRGSRVFITICNLDI